MKPLKISSEINNYIQYTKTENPFIHKYIMLNINIKRAIILGDIVAGALITSVLLLNQYSISQK